MSPNNKRTDTVHMSTAQNIPIIQRQIPSILVYMSLHSMMCTHQLALGSSWRVFIGTESSLLRSGSMIFCHPVVNSIDFYSLMHTLHCVMGMSIVLVHLCLCELV